MQFKKLEHIKAGEPITAAFLNAIAERLEMFVNLQSGSPYVRMVDSPYGKSIALAFPQMTWALLSGSSSPYSFTEVRDGPGGTWVSMPNGDSGTANVYEVNGKSGLGGKVVPIEWSAVGDWRFQWVGYNVDCDPATTKVNITVKGCSSLNLPGATVALTIAGVPYASGTTDASGFVSFGLTKKATYTITASSPTLTTATSTVTVTTCGGTQTRTITLTTPAGRICCGNVRTYPTTLFLSTPAGMATLTFDSFQGGWTGTISATANAWLGQLCSGPPSQWFPRCDVAAASRTVNLTFIVTCAFSIRMFWPTASAGNACVDASCIQSTFPPGTPCLPLSGAPSGSTESDTTFSGGIDPVLPQTATLPSIDLTGNCTAPMSGDVILSE